MDRFVVTWSPQVRDDLHDIAAYIAKDSPRYAAAACSKIQDSEISWSLGWSDRGSRVAHFPIASRCTGLMASNLPRQLAEMSLPQRVCF